MTTAGQVRTRTQRHSHTHRWMGWRKFITLIGGLAIAWPLASHAQQPLAPPKRVGIISTADTPCPIPSDHPIRRRLAELGWIAGQNIIFDCVSTVGRIDQGPALARELVSRRPDVLVADVYFYIKALMQETATIPIVMLNGWEPVRLGLITSFARPGGNVTGVAWFGLRPKQMELLKEIVPSLRRVAFIYDADPIPSEAGKIVTEDNRICGKHARLYVAVCSSYRRERLRRNLCPPRHGTY